MNTCVKTLSPQQARQLMMRSADYLLFDVRSRAEYQQMHLPGAIHAAAAGIAAAVMHQRAERSTPILIYCRVGLRSRAAAEELTRMGYTQVYDIGGIADWPYEVVSG
jgi:rhodanese-related sulfurtransferase